MRSTVLVVFVLAGLLAPLIAPYDPAVSDLAAGLLPPSADHWLGTDQLGRDQLSRLLYGAQISLTVTAAVLAVSLTFGVLVGTLAGYFGGWIDRVISRVIDMAVSLPGMLVALAVIGVRGPGVFNLVIAMSLWAWSPYARIARAKVAAMRDSPHLDALRLMGAGPARVIGRHLVPPALGPCLVYASTDVGAIVLGVATLSFLGLGIPPPYAEWGQMLIEGRPFLASAWWLAYPPGIAITAVVFASNLLGERLAGGDERPSILRWVLPARRNRTVAAKDDEALRVEGLSVGYPQRVVADVSYEVRRGEVLAVVGESGSGKTTSVLAPFGLVDPRAIVTGSITQGKRVGVVFQDNLAVFNPLRTIGSHVGEAVRNARRGRRTEELLTLVGLPASVARRYPHELSGGQRQRVQIAIAIAGEPELLIADEPTSALDVTVQAQLLDLLARLRDELNMAMIVVSHDLAVVARLADTVAVMYAGRIVEQGPLSTVINSPAHPYTRGLLDAVPRPGAVPGTRFRTMPGRSGAAPDDLAGCAFAPRCVIAVPECSANRPMLELIGAGHQSACPRKA
ncbi:dipeptide/oligopeptide/nickel ABC transporter ATP-binding protein [Acrocarpospora pleiomorpha]|uniref:Dipeptide/oligopeptide/nickel ABC transporter ATP-binding protein n=1 Tax=Acrocarpospora pleiomorpha TaxID=90975 RepID=A0A5M3XCK1_9ACTN|nr:dipeptide/oligopeptide/nickel ABC transporter permease/ATP-binding protein [Acrocarpospora pleiomorpha]GES17919.1 dipeptide/oligopeptide/nickel ABC transporter ATP-binding protein [Acrocarpospora pleiomorpha]